MRMNAARPPSVGMFAGWLHTYLVRKRMRKQSGLPFARQLELSTHVTRVVESTRSVRIQSIRFTALYASEEAPPALLVNPILLGIFNSRLLHPTRPSLPAGRPAGAPTFSETRSRFLNY